MLEDILKMYVMAMAGDVRSPIPHLFGPAGCGKSSSVEMAANILNVNLHIINVSRISPLELEGVQMPDKNHKELNLLTATYWSKLKEGDIVLLDEFLRGFPEVYNGLLDIMTSRQVGGFQLPKVFFIAASNSTVAYDAALSDRLLHLPVADPRVNKAEHNNIARMLVDNIGLLPEMAASMEMSQLLTAQVHPMYQIMDSLKNGGAPTGGASKGVSPRNLIGQAKLRHIVTPELAELLNVNNTRAITASHFQFVVLPTGAKVNPTYLKKYQGLRGNPKLTPIQVYNLEANAQLIALENARAPQQKKVKEEENDAELFGL